MTRAVLQAGLSWAQIDGQWERLLVAFDRFDPQKIASYSAKDVERLGQTPGIVHSERKLQATIHNARTMLTLEKEHGGFANYLASFATYDAASADIKSRFAYVGDISVYYFLFRVGRPVPPFERWSRTVKGEHPRIREMVAAAKTTRSRSPDA